MSLPRLAPVASEPGVWRSSNTAQAGPATYAFIVGISQYDLLDGSAARLGLRSLFVSALTAYRFFRYLAQSYLYDGGPMVEATLLLSPTPTEQRLFDADPDYPISAATAPRPTLDVMREAMQNWFARLDGLHPDDARQSRLFFFYSGHGLEMDPDRQLLLPVDYPGKANVYNNAPSTYNIHRGLGCLPIESQFYFVDACRNDVPSLYNLANLEGQQFLDPRRGQRDREAPILYASAPGEQAWQPKTAASFDDISYYGRALLDALLVRDPKFSPDCSGDPCVITFLPLLNYVSKTLVTALKDQNINRRVPVKAGGIVVDAVVSHWRSPVPPPAVPAEERAEAKSSDAGGPSPLYQHALEAARSREAAHASGTARFLEYLSDVADPPSGPSGAPAEADASEELRSYGPVNLTAPDVATRLHDALGHETLTNLVMGAQSFAWDHDTGWLPSLETIDLVDVERTDDASRAVGHLRFSNPTKWHWLETNPDDGGVVYGFLFPGSHREAPLYALEFSLVLGGAGTATGAISSVVSRLSERNTGALRDAARIWNAYRELTALGALDVLVEIANAVSAEHGADVDRAIDVLADGWSSSVAVSVAVMVLLRTKYHGRVRPWIDRFLASELADSSDLAVFGLQSMRLSSDWDAAAAQTYVQALIDYGTPMTSEGCAYFIAFVNEFITNPALVSSDQHSAFDRGAHELADSLRTNGEFQRMLSEFAGLAPVLRTGGLFTTLVAPQADMPRYRSTIA